MIIWISELMIPKPLMGCTIRGYESILNRLEEDRTKTYAFLRKAILHEFVY